MTVRVTERKDRKGFQVLISLRLPDGTRFRERVQSPVATRTASLRWGEQREALWLKGDAKKEALQEAPTLDAFWPKFMEGHARANKEKPSNLDTRERLYRLHIKPVLGHLTLEAIDDMKVQMVKGRMGNHSPKSVNNVLTIISKVLKVAVEWRVIPAMPCRVKLLKAAKPVVEFYEDEEYERLVSAAQATDQRTYLAVLLGGDAGLRSGEICGLEWSDVDHGRSLLKVQRATYERQVTLPKGGKPRIVPMTARLRAALQAHRHLRGDRVLYTDGNVPADRWWMKWALDVAERRAGLRRGGRIHILRHTFCSRLAARNVPMLTIQALAGHQSIETTMRYMHLSAAAPREGIRALESDTRTTPDEFAATKLNGGG